MTADTPAAASTTEQAWVLAQNFHAIYERLAPHFGYRTRPETRGWVADSPNGKLMQAVCKAMVDEGWIAPGAALSAPVAAPPADPLLGQALAALVRYANACDADAKTVAVIQALEARIDAAPPAASGREVLQQALAALETAHTGLMWYRGMMPQYVDGSDDEADEEITAAIEVLSTHLSTALTGAAKDVK